MLLFTWGLSIWDSGINKCFGFCFAIDFPCLNPGFRHTAKQQSAELRPPSPRCSASTSGRVTKHPQPLDQWSTLLDQNSCTLKHKHSQESWQVWERLVNAEKANIPKKCQYIFEARQKLDAKRRAGCHHLTWRWHGTKSYSRERTIVQPCTPREKQTTESFLSENPHETGEVLEPWVRKR